MLGAQSLKWYNKTALLSFTKTLPAAGCRHPSPCTAKALGPARPRPGRARPPGHLQNDVIEPDQVLGPGRALAVILRLRLQQGPLQPFRHVLVALDGRGQLDVSQVAGRQHMAAQVTPRTLSSEKNLRWGAWGEAWGEACPQPSVLAAAWGQTCRGPAETT